MEPFSLALGAGIRTVSVSGKVIHHLLMTHPVLLWSFFRFNYRLCVHIGRTIPQWRFKNHHAGLGQFSAFIVPSPTELPTPNYLRRWRCYPYILPYSGSFILLLMSSIPGYCGNQGIDLPVLVTFAAGAGLGFCCFLASELASASLCIRTALLTGLWSDH